MSRAGAMPSWFDEESVRRLLRMSDVIEAVERAFRAWGEGQAANMPRRRVRSAGAVLHSMAATADYLGLAGWKQYLTTRSGATFHAGIYHLHQGSCLALLEAARLGQMRTGAATAVAVKHLTPAGLNWMALIGTGFQAETQLEGVCCVRPIQQVQVYSRNEARRREFAQRMSERLNVAVTATATAEDAVRNAPLVITATNSRSPVVEDSWLADEVLVVAMGSNWPDKSELEPRTVATATCIVCDSIEACQMEAGELIQAAQQGMFDWSRAVELRDVICGRAPVIPRGKVLFKSVGLAIEDLAAAALLLTR